MRTGRRTAAIGAVLAAAMVLVGACGGSDDDTGGEDVSSEASGGGGFPRTVEHGLGSVTIEHEPERVVALGNDADIAASLGVTPLGAHENPLQPGEFSPWLTDLVEDTSEITPLASTDDPPIEQIAALEPDIILAASWWAIDDSYGALSEFGVPVIAYEESFATDSWQMSTGMIGEALGLEDEAAALIRRVEGEIEAAKAGHPQWDGTTFTFSVRHTGGIRTLTAPEDPSVHLFNELGFVLAEAADELPHDAAIGGADISLEQTELLEAEVVLFTYQDAELQDDFESDALFNNLPAVEESRYVAVDQVLAYALRQPSPLNIPFALEQLTPLLEDAIAGAT